MDYMFLIINYEELIMIGVVKIWT